MEEINQQKLELILKDINMYKVYSSNILAIGYSEKYNVLRVIFKNNTSYIYFNVEPEVYENIKNSQSKGKTLNESVVRQKNKYKYLKI